MNSVYQRFRAADVVIICSSTTELINTLAPMRTPKLAIETDLPIDQF